MPAHSQPSASSLPGRRSIALLALSAVVLGSVIPADPYLSVLVPADVWSAVGLYTFPFKGTVATSAALILLGLVVASIARAAEHREVLIVLLLVSLQIAGLALGALDALDVIPFLALAILAAEAISNPSRPVVISGLTFFALALVILDLPYLMIDPPVHFVTALIKFLRTILVVFLVVNLVRSEHLVRVFIRALLVVATISALVAIAQVAIFMTTGSALVLARDMDDILKPTPFGMSLRAHGLTPEPHMLVSFLLMAFPFALYSLMTSGSGWPHVRALLMVTLILIGVVLTWSYGGIVAAGAMIVVFAFFFWPHRIIHFMLGIATVPLFLYYAGLLDDVYRAIASEASMSTGIFQRRILLSLTFDELARNPWMGRGLDTVAHFSGNYWERTVHNAGMQAWAYLGPMGLLVYVAMILTLTTRVVILGFRGEGVWPHRFRVISVGLIGLIISMWAEPYFNSPIAWVQLAFAQAAILVYHSERRTGPADEPHFSRNNTRNGMGPA